MSALRIVRIDSTQRAAFSARVAALERLASYPIGDDTFRIDHGPDYFAFFDRLGQTRYYVAVDGDDVVAVGCGVLRTLTPAPGARPRRAWYLCDLKVHPEHRGRRIPLRILRRAFLPCYLRAPRGYAISMNPGDGRPNRVVKLLSHWRWTPIRQVGELAIWSLDADQARDVEPLIREHRGAVSYLSLAGVKDIVLGSTGQPMPLLHTQFDAQAGQHPAPRADHVHMVCAPEGDPLAQALRARGLTPGAGASLLAHGLRDCDWRFVQTSEI